MKLKKLFAGILAVAMMATMAAPAFAAKATDVETNNGKKDFEDVSIVTLSKDYKLANNDESNVSPAETIEFTVVNKSVKKAAKGITTDSMPTVTVANLDLAAGAAGGQKQSTTITLPIYTSVGVYTYEITEKDGNKAGVTYRTEPITLVVTVVNGDTAGEFVRIPALHIGGVDATKGDTIENTYSAGTLNIKKEVKGTMGDKSKNFKFTLKLEATDNKSYPDTYEMAVTATGDAELTNPTSIKLGEETTVYLHNDSTIRIANLPYGVKYTITEDDYTGEGDDNGYTTKVNSEIGRSKTDTVDASAENVEFVNSKGGVVDTGVILDNAPYIALMMVVVAGAAVMIIKKRRHFED